MNQNEPSALSTLIERYDGTHDLLILLAYGLSEDVARFKAHDDMPSIFDILWHMTAVKTFYCDIARGVQPTPYSELPRPESLTALLEWFDDVHREARDVLFGLEDSWVGSTELAPNHDWATQGFVVEMLCNHDTYHLGQISQNAWAFPEIRWPGWLNDDGAPYLFQVEGDRR